MQIRLYKLSEFKDIIILKFSKIFFINFILNSSGLIIKTYLRKNRKIKNKWRRTRKRNLSPTLLVI